jgi:hypothetical protein
MRQRSSACGEEREDSGGRNPRPSGRLVSDGGDAVGEVHQSSGMGMAGETCIWELFVGSGEQQAHV